MPLSCSRCNYSSVQQRASSAQVPTGCSAAKLTHAKPRSTRALAFSLRLRLTLLRTFRRPAGAQIACAQDRNSSANSTRLQAVQIAAKKYFICAVGQINGTAPPVSPDKGTYRDRHETWRRDAMDAAASGGFARRARTLAAYGEVVWSWRRDRGVYFAGGIPQTTVTTNAAHRGEHEVSRKAIARGKPGCLGCTCLIRVRFSLHCTRCCGRSQRPAFPAPSLQERDNEIAELGRNQVARMRTRACINKIVVGWAKRERAHLSCIARAKVGTAQVRPSPPYEFSGVPTASAAAVAPRARLVAAVPAARLADSNCRHQKSPGSGCGRN